MSLPLSVAAVGCWLLAYACVRTMEKRIGRESTVSCVYFANDEIRPFTKVKKQKATAAILPPPLFKKSASFFLLFRPPLPLTPQPCSHTFLVPIHVHHIHQLKTSLHKSPRLVFSPLLSTHASFSLLSSYLQNRVRRVPQERFGGTGAHRTRPWCALGRGGLASIVAIIKPTLADA